MRHGLNRSVASSALLLGLALVAVPGVPAGAGLLGKLLRDAGDAAGDVKPGRLKPGDAGDLSATLKRLAPQTRNRALAATLTPEGHWRLYNDAGKSVTAADAVEMDASLKWLLPDTKNLDTRPLEIFIQNEAFARSRVALDRLPRGARIHVVARGQPYRVLGRVPFGSPRLLAQVRSNLVVKLDTSEALSEAIWQTSRRFDARSLRVLSLDPAGPRRLAAIKTGDGARSGAPERVNPYALGDVFAGLRGQTVLLTGEVRGKLLAFQTGSGSPQTVILEDIRAAAKKADINLVVLNTDSPRQPGARNMLWQKVGVDGLDKAVGTRTLGDFLGALAEQRGPLVLNVTGRGRTHVEVRAASEPALRSRLPQSRNTSIGPLEELLSDIVSSVTSDVVTTGLDATLRSETYDREMNRRLVPWLPSIVHWGYIGLMVLGMIGFPVALRWWRRLFPVRPNDGYSSTLGYMLARTGRAIGFVFAYLPLVGIVAAPYHFLEHGWHLITMPYRLIAWIFGRRRAA